MKPSGCRAPEPRTHPLQEQTFKGPAEQPHQRQQDAEKAGPDPGEVNLTADISVDGLIEALDRLPEKEPIEFYRRIADNPKLWEGESLAGQYGPGYNIGNTRRPSLDPLLEDYPEP